MLLRRLSPIIARDLTRHPAVALLGPRQVGKTTLARTLNVRVGAAEPGSPGSTGTPPEYLDLENPVDLAKLDDTSGYLRSRGDRLLIIDEVQRMPGLFAILRGIIDERILAGRTTGHFLLLGPASIQRLRQSSESLAGRIAYRELAPIDILEAGGERQDALWIRGGFPRSLLAEDDEASVDRRANFVSTYLERDIPQLGPRIPATTLRRFWTMLAHRRRRRRANARSRSGRHADVSSGDRGAARGFRSERGGGGLAARCVRTVVRRDRGRRWRP